MSLGGSGNSVSPTVGEENLGVFGLDKCWVPTKTALSLPLLSWTGERKCDERLEG